MLSKEDIYNVKFPEGHRYQGKYFLQNHLKNEDSFTLEADIEKLLKAASLYPSKNDFVEDKDYNSVERLRPKKGYIIDKLEYELTTKSISGCYSAIPHCVIYIKKDNSKEIRFKQHDDKAIVCFLSLRGATHVCVQCYLGDNFSKNDYKNMLL